MEKVVSRIVIIWMIIIAITIGNLYKYMDASEAQFYRFGPYENFLVIGIKINTSGKYLLVVGYCFVNSLIRNIIHNILNSWLINSVQDINIIKPRQIKKFAYEVIYVATIYNWVDWYIYMNLLLAQVDMLLTEILADLIMSGLVTYYYLETEHVKNKTIKEEEVINPMILDEELDIV